MFPCPPLPTFVCNLLYWFASTCFSLDYSRTFLARSSIRRLILSPRFHFVPCVLKFASMTSVAYFVYCTLCPIFCLSFILCQVFLSFLHILPRFPSVACILHNLLHFRAHDCILRILYVLSQVSLSFLAYFAAFFFFFLHTLLHFSFSFILCHAFLLLLAYLSLLYFCSLKTSSGFLLLQVFHMPAWTNL